MVLLVVPRAGHGGPLGDTHEGNILARISNTVGSSCEQLHVEPYHCMS